MITNCLQPVLTNYQTLPQILRVLSLNGIEIGPREFTDYVEGYRQQNKELYLESCSKGYRFTTESGSIRSSCFQRIYKAASMIKNAKRDLGNLADRNQIALLDSILEQVEQIEKPKEIKEENKMDNAGTLFRELGFLKTREDNEYIIYRKVEQDKDGFDIEVKVVFDVKAKRYDVFGINFIPETLKLAIDRQMGEIKYQ